ncbi:uncharacterized protein UV8b_07599 [Ustilaginoidea virens]|uniref:RRM domain-containing protein n=1 Tax=Ustilaginoidea virens TaxID=1159556 RepID=A0A8E5MK76_USTVR|nr:uncharacterized protein UV8b_07599 [Ustilaginoidea virens]QUC23358.1 hypothetical protein UV8b_07599 [Ustilaginoidea virens]
MHLPRIVVGLAALLAPLAAAFKQRDLIDPSELGLFREFEARLADNHEFTKVSLIQGGRLVRFDVYSPSSAGSRRIGFKDFRASKNAAQILNRGHRRSIVLPRQE